MKAFGFIFAVAHLSKENTPLAELLETQTGILQYPLKIVFTALPWESFVKSESVCEIEDNVPVVPGLLIPSHLSPGNHAPDLVKVYNVILLQSGGSGMAERITQGIGGSRSTVRFDHMGEANFLLTDVPMSM